MPYSDGWGATVQNDFPTPGDVTLFLTDSLRFPQPVTCTGTAKTEIGARAELANCFLAQPGPAPRLWWLRYRIAHAVLARSQWAALKAVMSAGNQTRTVTRLDPDTGRAVTRTAAQWAAIFQSRIDASQADWDARVAAARAEGADE